MADRDGQLGAIEGVEVEMLDALLLELLALLGADMGGDQLQEVGVGVGAPFLGFVPGVSVGSGVGAGVGGAGGARSRTARPSARR